MSRTSLDPSSCGPDRDERGSMPMLERLRADLDRLTPQEAWAEAGLPLSADPADERG